MPRSRFGWMVKTKPRYPYSLGLARDGHSNARIFLAQIERSSNLTSDYVHALTREERNVLFRALSGLSGTSWLKVEASDSELVAALYIAGTGNAADVGKRLVAAIFLLEHGERMHGFATFMGLLGINEFPYLPP